MTYVVEPPIGALNTLINNGLNGLNGASAVLLGALLGWIKSCDEKTRCYCKDYLGVTKDEFVPWAMVRLCWSSVCDTAIAQMQDILCLDDKARMNTPSTVGANWKWRLESFDKLDDTLAERLAKITAVYGRYRCCPLD